MAKKRITKKQYDFTENYDDLFGNPLKIPTDIQKELDEKGLVGRWVNAKTVAEYHGYHPKEWSVYRSEEYGKMQAGGLKFGSDPDGVVRRGDCLLAVKPKEAHIKHKAFLKRRADGALGVIKRSADQLRQAAKESNTDTHVIEGYEE